MSDCNDCKACKAIVKAFGNRFNGCRDVLDHVVKAAMKVIIETSQELRDEVDTKRLTGAINNEDYEVLKELLKWMVPNTAGMMPVEAMEAEGRLLDPNQMMSYVSENINDWEQKKVRELVNNLLSNLEKEPEPEPEPSEVN